MKLSVITSLYRSESFVNEFYNRVLSSIKKLGLDYEIIFVNDGSPDNSEFAVAKLAVTDKNVKLVNLSRNFGQYPAMFAGMHHATGDYIYTLDCDLEEEPENLVEFYNIMQQEPQTDVVYGVVKERNGGFVRAYLGKVFFDILDVISEYRIPRNTAWLRLMKRRYLDSLLSFTEYETFPAGLLHITGFNQKPVLIEKRFKGHSSYSLSKRMGLALNAIVSFSSKPLILVGLLGMSIAAIAFFVLLIIIIEKILVVNYQAGWISVIFSIWFIGGLILSSIGLLGMYLSKVFNQTKHRPLYIVKSTINL
ncbi:MAG: glycosyltransferase family 2 protein [Bacteroidia bacterium]